MSATLDTQAFVNLNNKTLMSSPVSIPEEQLQDIEAKLREDIAWTVFNGPGFSADRGCRLSTKGHWRPHAAGFLNEKLCGLCAIGSYVVRRQPKDTNAAVDYVAFAYAENVPVKWAQALYIGVAYAESQGDVFPRDRQAAHLAKRLVLWAEECKAKKATLDSSASPILEPL